MKNLHLDRRSRYSLQAIRSALFELLDEKELKNITVTDICRLADINRGTFYKYYSDVPDLFSKIEFSIAEETCEIIKADCLNNFSIEKLISNILNTIVSNRDFTRMLAKNASETQYLRNLIQAFRPQLTETLLNHVPDITESMSDICFDFLLGGVVNLLFQWINRDMTPPIEEMEILLTRFIYAILDDKIYASSSF